MKKTIVIALVLLIVAGGVLLSYSVSKNKAEIVAQKFSNQLSPLKGSLVLLIDNKFEPCWAFRGEHKEIITGTTFNVYVSLFGKVKEDKMLGPKERP